MPYTIKIAPHYETKALRTFKPKKFGEPYYYWFESTEKEQNWFLLSKLSGQCDDVFGCNIKLDETGEFIEFCDD